MNDKVKVNFSVAIIIIGIITFGVFLVLVDNFKGYHMLSYLFILIAELLFVRGLYRIGSLKEFIKKPTGESFGIYTVNMIIMILMAAIFSIEEGKSLFMFILIELFLIIIELLIFQYMVTSDKKS